MPLTDSDILYHLQQLSPDDFEHFIADLWEQLGWKTEVTVSSRDRGVDVIAEQTIPYHQKLLIQAKRYQSNNRVGSPEIREYSALKQQEKNVDQVLIVTTSEFTRDAREIASDLNVKCINGESLVQLIQDSVESHILEEKLGIDQRSLDESKPDKLGGQEESGSSPESIIGVGGDIVAELIGYDRVRFSSGSDLAKQKSDFDGLFVGFNLHTRNLPEGVWLPIEYRDEVNFVDINGTSHKPVVMSEKPLAKGWQTHDSKEKSQDDSTDIDIRIKETTEYIAAVELKSIDLLSHIEIDRYSLKIDMDKQSRSDISNLPQDIKISLRSVRELSFVNE